MDELEYTIEQNKRMLVNELDKVAAYVASLKASLESGQVSNITDWTDGYAARDVAKVTSLLAKHQGLSKALRIVSKS
jgi:hypothetical protein